MFEFYGFHMVVEAINELPDKFLEDTALIIVTYTQIKAYTQKDLKYSNNILNHIKKLKNVKLYNNLKPSEFALILKESDIFIRATDKDGDAVSVREAIYFNKQILASDCVDRPNGVLLFKTMDKDDFKEKLMTILLDSTIGKAVNKIKTDEQIIGLYEKIIDKGLL